LLPSPRRRLEANPPRRRLTVPDLRRLVGAQAGEVTQLDEFGLQRIFRGQLVERLIESKEFVVGFRSGNQIGMEFFTLPRPIMLGGLLATGVIHENPSHRLGRGSEEMTAPIESLIRAGSVSDGRPLATVAHASGSDERSWQ
jgi:hypothetical protein